MSTPAHDVDSQIAQLDRRIYRRFSDRVLNLDPRLFRTMDVREVRVLALWAKRYHKRYEERLVFLQRELDRRGDTRPVLP